MSKLNGNNIIQEISAIALLFTDQEIKKHFGEDSPKVFRKAAKRIEEAYRRGEDEKVKDSKT